MLLLYKWLAVEQKCCTDAISPLHAILNSATNLFCSKKEINKTYRPVFTLHWLIGPTMKKNWHIGLYNHPMKWFWPGGLGELTYAIYHVFRGGKCHEKKPLTLGLVVHLQGASWRVCTMSETPEMHPSAGYERSEQRCGVPAGPQHPEKEEESQSHFFFFFSNKTCIKEVKQLWLV